MRTDYYIPDTHEESGEKNLKVMEDLRFDGGLLSSVMI